MESPNRPYLPEIDHLRAYAALLILLYHGQQLIGSWMGTGKPFDGSTPWQHPANPLLITIIEGHSAVALFVTLSGFILTFGVLDRKIAFSGFIAARALRVLPMMVVCLILAISTAGADLTTVISSLVPIDPRLGVSSTFTAMFWAVKVEMQCYLLFPFLLLALQQQGLRGLGLLVLTLLALRVLAVLAVGADPRDLSYWTLLGRLDQFVIGMIAAKVVKDNLGNLSPVWFVPAVSASLVMLSVFNRLGGWPAQGTWRVFFPPIEASVWACVIVTYLSAGRLMPRFLSRLIAAWGTISFSVYLLHFSVIDLVNREKWWIEPTGQAHWDSLITTAVLVVPIISVLAALTYKTVEQPFMRLRPKYAEKLVGR